MNQYLKTLHNLLVCMLCVVFLQSPSVARQAYPQTEETDQVDTLDHASEADLKQASVVMASFLYHAAMREERIPRKPLLTE